MDRLLRTPSAIAFGVGRGRALKLQRALLAISVGPKPLAKADHPRPKGRGILAKESICLLKGIG
ncbi:MAG TPA: hypothetical protein VMW89_01500 [Desulfatiglandales bacterium]|nr:hypothetical protein [Desulfatiglandales bacterium]